MENFQFIKSKKEYMNSRLALQDSMIPVFPIDTDIMVNIGLNLIY
jgi:hypothetical protein